jgi:two-component system, NarL family, response regulator
MKPKIQLMLVDDHPAFRRGVEAVLSEEPDFSVVAQASNAADALRLLQQVEVNVILLDLRLPDVGGVECAVEMRRLKPTARIIILTTYDHDHDILRALQAGVSGYLLKDCALEELCAAIRNTMMTGFYLPEELEKRARRQLMRPSLTPRELDLLRSIVAGRSNKEAALELGVGEETVKSHLKAVLRKLSVHDRTQAAVAALKMGLVEE